ncbi:MAG: response regulator [Planctomycetota bacterium]|nr:response regulator [Planctomycetota bacterium]
MAHDRRRILIADDDSEIRLGAAELLDSLGHVLQAGDGEEALEVVRNSRNPFHLALLDLQMPRRGGYEVFGVLREEYPDLPCILWSGDATEHLASNMVRAGAMAFLHKPVPPEELRGHVRRVLTERWGDPL